MKLGKQTVYIKSIMHRNWMDTEMRVRINELKVEQYAEEKKNGMEFPEPIVFIDPHSETLHVGDGFHRILAEHRNRKKSIPVELKRGTKLDAIKWNIDANSKQRGLPFGPGDFRKAILTLLNNDETSKWSQKRIAEFVGCSHTNVWWAVKQFEADGGKKSDTIIDANGVPRKYATGPREETAQRANEMIQMLGQGKSRKEIAESMNLSYSTVKDAIQVALADRNLRTCPRCKGTGTVVRESAPSSPPEGPAKR